MRPLFLVSCVLVWSTACSPTLPPVPAAPTAADVAFPLLDRPMCDDAVLSALERYDAAALLTRTKAGATMSCGNEELMTPLDVAVLRDEPALVRAVLEAGANPNLRWSDHGDRFPLQEAIEARSSGRSQLHRAEIVALLLKHGADVNARWCPFESRGSDGGGLACRTATAPTPLMMAAVLNQADIVGLLLAAGADATVQDRRNETALEWSGSEDVFGLILMLRAPGMIEGERGAIEDFKRRNSPPYSRGASGQTLLTDAIYRHRYGLMRLALGAGADPNLFSSDEWGEWVPIAHAVRAAWVPGVELLLTRGADPNGRSCPRGGTGERRAANGCQRQTGLTPMMLAAAGGDAHLAHLLRNHGGDQNAVDWLRRTASDHAKVAGHRDPFLGPP